MDPFEQMKKAVPNATDITLTFEWKRKGVSHYFAIKEDSEGGYSATWKNMDTNFEGTIGNRAENTFADLLHEIRIHTSAY